MVKKRLKVELSIPNLKNFFPTKLNIYHEFIFFDKKNLKFNFGHVTSVSSLHPPTKISTTKR